MESDSVLEVYKRSKNNAVLDIILILTMMIANHTTLLTEKALTVQTNL